MTGSAPDQITDHRLVTSNNRLLERWREGHYDFVDLGTCDGGGFVVGHQMGGHSGLGFDIDPKSVIRNLDAGRDVAFLDVVHLRTLGLRAKFAICHHILEHLEDIYDVGSTIKTLSRICDDFIFIAGPCFDHEDYLYRRNLKAFHTAMPDHLCHFTTGDLGQILNTLGLRRYAIGLSLPMLDSDNRWIARADALDEMWRWEESRSLARTYVKFEPPLYRDLVCVVALDPKIDPIEQLNRYEFGGERVEKIIFHSVP